MANSWAAEWSIITILLGFAVFFLFFFILSPKDKMMIFLCLATVGLAVRPLFTSHFLILNVIDMDWTWIIRFEYIGLYLIIIGWSWFIVHIYPSQLIRMLTWFFTIFYSMAFFATLFLPVKIFTFIMARSSKMHKNFGMQNYLVINGVQRHFSRSYMQNKR